jgi:hypothetical protein
LLLHASHAALAILNSSKLPPVVDAADLIVLQIIDKTIRNSKFRCLSEATPYHHNVFTFTLFLPEGRAGVAWEPSNKIMLFLPPRKIIRLHTVNSPRALPDVMSLVSRSTFILWRSSQTKLRVPSMLLLTFEHPGPS